MSRTGGVLGSDIVGESRKIRARIGDLSTPPDHPRSLPIGIFVPRVNGAASCSAETNTLRRTEWYAQSLVLQDVSERPRSFCFHGSGTDGRARRRKTGRQAVCARLWRADACAQGMRAQRAGATPPPEGGKKPGAARVHSVKSHCGLQALPRRLLSMRTSCARLHWPRTMKVVALSRFLSLSSFVTFFPETFFCH